MSLHWRPCWKWGLHLQSGRKFTLRNESPAPFPWINFWSRLFGVFPPTFLSNCVVEMFDQTKRGAGAERVWKMFGKAAHWWHLKPLMGQLRSCFRPTWRPFTKDLSGSKGALLAFLLPESCLSPHLICLLGRRIGWGAGVHTTWVLKARRRSQLTRMASS